MELDVQDMKPEVSSLPINKVGIRNMPTLAEVDEENFRIKNIKVDAYVDLQADKKGIHASRITGSINALNKTDKKFTSLEEVCREVLNRMKMANTCKMLEVSARGNLFIERLTPVSRMKSMEMYKVATSIIENGRTEKVLEVRAIGNCLCPCMLMRIGKSHIQRAELAVKIRTRANSTTGLLNLIDACESSFSSPTFGLVKVKDEESIVETMFQNPRFVEDLVRTCLTKLRQKKVNGKVEIRAIAYESIHKHDMFAQINSMLR